MFSQVTDENLFEQDQTSEMRRLLQSSVPEHLKFVRFHVAIQTQHQASVLHQANVLHQATAFNKRSKSTTDTWNCKFVAMKQL